MTFHEWYKQRKSFDSIIGESDWTMAGIHMGQHPDVSHHLIDNVQKIFQKIDSIVGMKKFLQALPKAALSQVLFLIALIKFIRNPNSLEALKGVVDSMGEALKMGIYSGATVPLGAIIGNIISPGTGGVAGGIIAKAVSYGYFYMGQWADLNSNNPKYAELSKKIREMMPKSMTKKNDPKKASSWFSKWINRNKPEDPIS